ncbi:MAG TPA: MarP family serine protease [Candidatus Nanopelagicales bacterium]|nr:MarP family serine protease [Candidatus Nanopelagicales bacterium]
MNGVDVLLVVLAVLAVITGWRQGLISGVLSFLGFIIGAFVGASLAPVVLKSMDDGWLKGGLGILIVLACAGVGNLLAGWLGAWIRSVVTWKPARVVDSAGGSMFGVLSLAFVAWVVASALIALPLGPVSTQVRGSKVLGEIDTVLPGTVRDGVSNLRNALDSTGFPDAFAGFTLDPSIPVAVPDTGIVSDRDVRASVNSVVKVEGQAPGCGSVITGSGFVFARDRVMTNAHVVAGTDQLTVTVRGVGTAYDATVVYFDPDLDVAVLSVHGLGSAPLEFARNPTSGAPGAVAGFPHGGRLSVSAARVRAVVNARGSDIYGHGTVTREIVSLRGTVISGDSGGPLLDVDGRVSGVVFASSETDPETGYALTPRSVRDAAAAGATATRAVSTGSCATA